MKPASVSLRGLLMMTRNTLMATLTYRGHFLFEILSSILRIVIMFYLWKAVYASSGSTLLHGMAFTQTFLYVAFASALFILTKTWTDWFMWEQIRFGGIVVEFFRPLDYMAGMFFGSLGHFAGNLLMISAPSVIATLVLAGIPPSMGLPALLVVPSIFLAFILNFLFDYFIGTMCFWTESIWGISITKEVVILFLSGAVIPLPFFPAAAQPVLALLPFKAMYHTPLSILTNPALRLGDHLKAMGLQLAWILLLTVACRMYFRLALKKITVAGG